ncbi:hypothetical protein [Aquisediminimonas sediminicola]|uniref:hypothetical protein n=1 Tax=Alteraquisediminimonas sediminicola TaxID=2676787 RepID=UPI001C8E4834|nr:hypothetical protein [Aquisediminimonas sediminicola]
MSLRKKFCSKCETAFTATTFDNSQFEFNAFNIGALVLVLFVFVTTWVMSDSPAPPLPEKPSATGKTDATAIYYILTMMINQCDQSNATLIATSSSDDLGDAYYAAHAMEVACTATYATIERLKIPTSLGRKVHESLSKTVKICENEYKNRAFTASRLQDMINVCVPSVENIAELRGVITATSDDTILCSIGLANTAKTAGITQADLAMVKIK